MLILDLFKFVDGFDQSYITTIKEISLAESMW